MTAGHLDAARVRIGAPDAQLAFALERRLRHLHAVAVGRGPAWEVDLERYEGGRAELEAAVRRWLGDSGLAETRMLVDGVARCVRTR